MNRILSWAGRKSAGEGTKPENCAPSAQEHTDEPWFKVPVQSTAQQSLFPPFRDTQSLRPSLESSISRDGEALGFKVLAHGHNANVDIVAVHGLNGHREKTWTAKDGTLWLRDFLPSRIPQARVLTYGYDARTHGSSHGSGHITVQYLYDHATAFVSKLSAFRSNTKTENRPLIFIAHSLGGILVKSALIHSQFCGPRHLPELQAIKTCTYGIFFFGTPHAGSNSASWAVAILNIASLFSNTNTSIVKHLQTNSEWLRQSMDQFTAISGDFEIKYCYEQYKTPLALGKSTLIVPRHSAMVGGAPNAEAIGLRKDHKELVRFNSLDDEDLVVIMSRLEIMVSKCHKAVHSRWNYQEAQNEAQSQETETKVRKHDVYRLSFRPPVERNRLFVGRKAHLQQVKAGLHGSVAEHGGSRSPLSDRVVVLYGLGGMGKTQLALKYVAENAEKYSAVLWINASNERNAHLGFRDTAKRYVDTMMDERDPELRQTELRKLHLAPLVNVNGEVSWDEANLGEITKSVINFLERDDNDNWLLILDNVDDLQSLDITDFLPKSPTRKVIVTSRLTATTRLGYAIEVDAIDEEDAVEILLNNSPLRTKSTTDSDTCKKISKTLGYLPLALEQAGAYISDGQLQLDEYLPLFDRYRQELLSGISPGEIFSARKETVFTTWELSFTSVLLQDDAAAQLMLLFAFMHHEALWEGMFLLAAETQTSASLTSPLESLSWFQELCRDPLRFRTAIGRILSVSLAKRGPSPGSLYLHPLVHAWSRDRLKPEQRAQKQLQAVVVLGQALFSISRVAQTTETWGLKKRILLHADVCIGFAKSTGTSTHFYTLFREPSAVHALLQVTNLYHDMGKLKQAEELLGSILSLAVENSPEELILECQLKLADILVMLGRHEEAVQRYLEVLTSIKKYGDKEEMTLKAHTGLGRVYWVMMNYPESEYNLKVVTTALKSSTGKLGPLGQQAASNLGLLYWHKGELAEALNTLDEVLDEIGQEHVENDITLLEHMYRRAIIVQFMGDYQEAKRTFSKVLTERQELLGSDNLETCQAANALGRVHCSLGEYELAQKRLDAAWYGQERIGLGMSHPAVLRTLFNYGVLNREKGLYNEAFECLDRSGLWQRNLGERHHPYLCCRIELAIVEMDRGEPDTAVKILRSVRQIQQEDYPEHKPECIQAVIALADALTRTGELSEADLLLAMIIPIVKEAFGERYPALLHAVTSRSRLRRLQGRAADAVEDLENTLNTLATVYGDAHQSTLMAGALLGQIYGDIGRVEEGREKISKACSVMENILGSEHPKTREVQGMLADLLAGGPASMG